MFPQPYFALHNVSTVNAMPHFTAGDSPNRCPAVRSRLGAALLALAVVVTLSGCDAPRDNPLDPKGSNAEALVRPESDIPTLFTAFRVLTRHEPEYPNILEDELFLAIAEVEAHDGDGIEKMELLIADSLRYRMAYIPSRQLYRYAFNPADVGVDIFKFIGSSFYAYCYDERGFVQRSERGMIIRVLEEIPRTIYPKSPGAPALEPSPTLIWREYESRYPISYDIAIYIVRGSELETIYQAVGVPRETAQGDTLDSLQTNINLAEGQSYSWTVTVRDQFGNSSISKSTFFSYEDTTETQAE